LPIEQAFAIFEGCLNWCIYTHAHQYLIIHAAAVERGGRALILPAPPGSGKSTLCAAMVSRGWRLLTDELTLIDLATHAIFPLARPVSLKNESIEVLRNFAPEAVFGPASPNTIKGTVAHMRPPADSVRRVHERCLPAWIVTPKYAAGQPLTAKKMSPGESFMMLAGSSVNYMLHGASGFDLLTSVIDGVKSFALEYSDLDSALSWFDDLVASHK
jgi:HprK-related kinase A